MEKRYSGTWNFRFLLVVTIVSCRLDVARRAW